MVKNNISITENDFLSSASVREFLFWIERKLDGPEAFVHQFRIKKTRTDWSCDSIYNAYENYVWLFRFHDPKSGTPISGSSFAECAEVLDGLSATLRQSIKDSDAGLCARTCCAILSWGGVLIRNDACIASIGSGICEYLQKVGTRLQKDMPSGEYYFDGMKMNSGFTKIYSLCADDFIIYDGRPRRCSWSVLQTLLRGERPFRYSRGTCVFLGAGKGRGTRGEETRAAGYTYIRNSARTGEGHLENNIRANWLIKEITRTTASRFAKLEDAFSDEGAGIRAVYDRLSGEPRK